MGSVRCLSEWGLSVDFTPRRPNLKTSKVLVKPSFNKNEWVANWSNLMISCLQAINPVH